MRHETFYMFGGQRGQHAYMLQYEDNYYLRKKKEKKEERFSYALIEMQFFQKSIYIIYIA